MEIAERNVSRKAGLDMVLFSSVIMLACIGAAAVFSSTFQQGLDRQSPDPFYFIQRHLTYLCIAISAMYFAMRINEDVLNRYAIPLLLTGIGLLLLVFIPPFESEKYGARRWVNFFYFTFQPAEILKSFFIIYIARFIAERRELVKDFWRGLTPVVIIYAFISILLLLQPDKGSAILIGILMGVMLLVGGTRIGYFGILFILLVFLIIMVLLFSPEKMSRMIGWYDPFRTAEGDGYQIINSIQSFSLGGLTGMGQGGAVHTSGGFLPMASMDFILAVIGEEYGFIGITTVVALYMIIGYRGMRITAICRDEFSRLLSFGLTLIIIVPALIHMFVALGMLPSKGLTLPFVSYGGTSLIVSFFCAGLLEGIYLRNQPSETASENTVSGWRGLVKLWGSIWNRRK